MISRWFKYHWRAMSPEQRLTLHAQARAAIEILKAYNLTWQQAGSLGRHYELNADAGLTAKVFSQGAMSYHTVEEVNATSSGVAQAWGTNRTGEEAFIQATLRVGIRIDERTKDAIERLRASAFKAFGFATVGSMPKGTNYTSLPGAIVGGVVSAVAGSPSGTDSSSGGSSAA